ncbi:MULTISPECIES: hypothetical protein [Flavobacterium]|uniref:Uncharacterized protein n=1 Tax=Flavobacterium columnare TaxID=996 RepID=A0AA94EZZ1_9FLAO|nr:MULTISPECIES: hypothetical protein [Flavobacterium]MCH4829784.1 hypothetical protein [Flavobacterium columnare]MCH4831236.1 hypothetical protein [Flavobacterium columnare]MCH4831583.1 hypothetical protein [Flavobacterium columnare]MCH4831613.1 hypothetical protein [Flavobacterium columnare]MCH4831650.1 hypothetical protein [Flavobacterium columnare]
MSFTPLINGREYGWADIIVNISATPLSGIKHVKYEEEQEKENIYGAGRHPVARGYGRVKTTGSITLLSGTVFAMQAAAPGNKLHNIAPFPIVVMYQPETGAIVKHTLKNCEFKKTAFDWKEGDLSKDIELELIISHIE